MKNNKFSRIAVLVLTFSLCIGVLFAFGISAEDDTQTQFKPDIHSQNVEYGEKFSLMYAVDADSVAQGPVYLYLYEENPANDGAEPIKVYEQNEITQPSGNLTKASYIFTTDGVAAYAMTKEFYVKAVDAQNNESDVKKYSVGEYFYQMIASTETLPEQKAFYNASLKFGASAQKVIAKETDETKLVTNFCYVTSLDGTTVNGFEKGIYAKGSSVTVNTTGAEKCTVITDNTSGFYVREMVNNGSTFTLANDAVAVKVYTGSRVVYRDQVETFDDATTSYFSGSGVTKSLQNTDDRGMVYAATMPAGKYINHGTSPSQDKVSSSEAIALEFSFDIKIESTAALDNTMNVMLEQRYNNGSSTAATYRRTKMVFGNGYLVVANSAAKAANITAGTAGKAYEDIKLGDWFHVRVVMYENDKNQYIYINGEDTPYVNTSSESSGSSYTGDLAKLTQTRISVASASFDIKIDNFFYGYTMDKNPNAQ